jgi:hypothetical protein
MDVGCTEFDTREAAQLAVFGRRLHVVRRVCYGCHATVLGWCAFGMLAILAMVAVLFAAGCEVRWPSSFYQCEQEGA